MTDEWQRLSVVVDRVVNERRREMETKWIVSLCPGGLEILTAEGDRVGSITLYSREDYRVSFVRVEELDFLARNLAEAVGYVRGVERATQVYGDEILRGEVREFRRDKR